MGGVIHGWQQFRQTGKQTRCHADDSGVFPELENKDVDLVMRTLSGLQLNEVVKQLSDVKPRSKVNMNIR